MIIIRLICAAGDKEACGVGGVVALGEAKGRFAVSVGGVDRNTFVEEGAGGVDVVTGDADEEQAFVIFASDECWQVAVVDVVVVAIDFAWQDFAAVVIAEFWNHYRWFKLGEPCFFRFFLFNRFCGFYSDR